MNPFKSGQYIVPRGHGKTVIIAGCISSVGKNDGEKVLIKNLATGGLAQRSASALASNYAVVSPMLAFRVVDIFRTKGRIAACEEAIKISLRGMKLEAPMSSSLESTIFQFRGLTTKDQQAFARRVFKDVLDTMFGVTVTKER